MDYKKPDVKLCLDGEEETRVFCNAGHLIADVRNISWDTLKDGNIWNNGPTGGGWNEFHRRYWCDQCQCDVIAAFGSYGG